MTNKSQLVVGLSLALLAGSVSAATKYDADDTSLLVIFKEQVSKEERQQVIRGVGGLLRDMDDRGRDLRMRHVAQGRINEIRVANQAQRDRALKRLTLHPMIEVVEPNYVLSLYDTQFNPLSLPNDPHFASLWGLHNTGQSGGTPGADISALAAWEITTGSDDIVIGVIDSGVDYNHPDLAANIWVNPHEDCTNGIDDSGNGVIDDCHGYASPEHSGDPNDVNGHGTHVAGTIGGVGNNGIGVTGVNWNVKIAACRFLDMYGDGYLSDAIACIDYFTDLKVSQGINIVATNNSWGGPGYSATMREAIQSGIDAGILFIAAAGNDGLNSDIIPSYPGSYDLDGIINVANTTRTDALASNSTYGEVSVDLGAPGTQIVSTYLNNGYATASGTSMAAPHVAGVAGLIWSIAPALDPLAVKDIILSSGDPIPALAGRTVTGKRLNAHQALLDTSPEPGFTLGLTPASLTIQAGNQAEFTLSISSIAEWNGEVALEASVAPELPVTLSSDTAWPGETVTLTIDTSADTTWGEYAITLIASDTDTGDLNRQAAASLHVLPANLVDLPYENTTPVAIPDANANGITSVIRVNDEGIVFGAEVSVNISHTWIGDLIVHLTSPSGTEHMLHNRSGSNTQNLIETWSVSSFNGEPMQGDWTLFVSDNAFLDTGTLNYWGLVLSALSDAEPQPGAPLADFSYSASGLSVSFTNQSSADRGIVSYAWDFGDGATSGEENPTHTYAEAGTYQVSLLITDTDDQQDSVQKTLTLSLNQVEVSIISATKLRTGIATVQLQWSGANGPVDIYRDGDYIGSFSDTRLRDRFTTSQDSVHYRVCPQNGSRSMCGDITYQF